MQKVGQYFGISLVAIRNGHRHTQRSIKISTDNERQLLNSVFLCDIPYFSSPVWERRASEEFFYTLVVEVLQQVKEDQ